MTIQGWVLFGILALFILSFGIFGAIIFEKIVRKVLSVVAAMLLIIGLFAGMRCYQGGLSMGIPGIRCLTCIHIKVCSLKPTLLMYEMMAKEMGISLHCPNYIDTSRLRPEKGQKDDAS